MIGAILGDIIGSTYEGEPTKDKNFPIVNGSFTDDSVMTVAVAAALMSTFSHIETIKDPNIEMLFKAELITSMKAYGRAYSFVGYGEKFYNWIMQADVIPYGSIGNGSAMRVSSIGWVFSNLKDTLKFAKWSAEVTHNTREAIIAAQAVAACIYWARRKKSKEYMVQRLRSMFGYPMDKTVDQIRPNYKFEVTCSKSVPEAIQCFIESDSVMDAIRNAVSLGGDADTQAAIAGSIAEAYYGIDSEMLQYVEQRLDLSLIYIVHNFYEMIGLLKVKEEDTDYDE